MNIGTNKLEVHEQTDKTNKRTRDALERIDVMRSHEEGTTKVRCVNYFTPVVNATCRRLMIDWSFTVIDAFGLNRETVGMAMSILDRYLSSDKGKSNEARNSTKIFQRSVITSLYIAIKIHEPTVLGVQLLVKLCRGVYTESEIITTELEILSALEWRVYNTASMSIMEYDKLIKYLATRREGTLKAEYGMNIPAHLLLPPVGPMQDPVLKVSTRLSLRCDQKY